MFRMFAVTTAIRTPRNGRGSIALAPPRRRWAHSRQVRSDSDGSSISLDQNCHTVGQRIRATAECQLSTYCGHELHAAASLLMSALDYFLPKAADEGDFSAWSSIMAQPSRVLRTNLFGDVFIVDGSGGVHMLERGACTVTQIASSEEEFWRRVDDDAEGWQLRPLADECRGNGKVLADGQCYAFTTPPVLGGDYAVGNVWVAPCREWFALTADLFQQIKNLPDGASVSFRVTD